MARNHNCKRKECGINYDKNKVARSLGKHSPVVTDGYCSAQCYTKDTMEKMKAMEDINLIPVLEQARNLLLEAHTQMDSIKTNFSKTQVGYVETTNVQNRMKKFLDDTQAING